MDDFDSKYEFNAPKFIDFTKGDQNDDADKWFDEREGDEGGIDLDLVPYYEEALGKNGFKNATSAISAALNNEFPSTSSFDNESENKSEQKDTDNEKSDVDEVEVKQRKSYLPTETESADNADCSANNDTEQEDNVEEEYTVFKVKTESVSYVASNDEMDTDEPTIIKQEQNTLVTTSDTENDQSQEEQNMHSSRTSDIETTSQDISEGEVAMKPRKSNIRTSWNSSPAIKNQNNTSVPVIKRNGLLRRSTKKSIDYSDTKKRKNVSVSSDVEPIITKKKKTNLRPETPSFVRKLRERGIKKTESTEAAQLIKIKELQQKTRSQIKRNHKIKKTVLKGQLLPNKVVSICPVTKPKEFHFATNERLKEHTMQTRSEDQHRSFENQLRQHPPSPTFKKEVTKPKPFNFHVADKNGSGHLEKKWQSMAQSTMNYQTKTPDRFRNKLKKGDEKLNDKKKKMQTFITHPKTPNLMTKTRSRPVTVISADDIEQKECDDMKSYQFKATEFNRKIVEKQGMYGVKQMAEVHTTSVKPFHFQSDSRMNLRKHKLDDSGNESSHAKSNSSLNSTKHDTHSSGGKMKKTEVKPFSFESRDKARLIKREEKIKEIISEEEKLREFHARPLPSFSPDSLPPVESKKATNPEPFKISHGSMAYQQKLKQKLQCEEADLKAKRAFKAQENVVTKKEPFKPITGLIPVTNVSEAPSHLESRAKDRAKFEEWKHEQERVMEQEKIRIQNEKEAEEIKAIKQLRKEAVPKSHAIRSYKAVEIHKNLLPVTEPVTPNFRTGKRAVMRN